jgi:hypothetical protein
MPAVLKVLKNQSYRDSILKAYELLVKVKAVPVLN